MKKSFVSSLCLLLLGVSLCSPSFAQPGSSKKRSLTVPVLPAAPVTIAPSVEISEGAAFADGINGVFLNWTTSVEAGKFGFNIYRVDADGSRAQVNSSLIGGSFLRRSPKFPQESGAAYSSYDRAGNPDSNYYIESIDLVSGGKILYGPVSPLRIKNISSKIGYDPQLRPDLADRQNDLIVKNYPLSLPDKDSSAAAAESTLADPVKQQWVAAQPGVKIQVRKSGIYRVSRAQLQAAGFNVAISPVLWQIYVDGEEQKMIVDPAGDFIEFYGSGVDNQNSDSRYYYLVAGPQAGQRIPTVFRSPFSPNIQGKNFRNITVFEQRINYINQIVNGDLDNWFGAILSPSTAVSRNVTVKDIDTNRQKAFVEIKLHGFLAGTHHVQVTLNGLAIGFIDFAGLVPAEQTFHVNASNIIEGTNTFEFIGLAGGGDFTLLKSIKIDYPRFYRADQNMLAFDTQHQHATKVTGFDTANVRVFDLAFPGSPQLIGNTTTAAGANGFDVSIPSGRGHPMIAVNENSLLSPVAVTPNAPSQLSAGASNADMLIVSHGNFMSSANAWAAYRRSDGLNVDVVNVEDVFDEFDYGLPTPKALKGFLQYAKNTYPNFKYVMFVGDATYDPRNYLGTGYNDFIPTKFINTAEGESPSDETLGDFNNDGVAEMALGRLPVRDNATIAMLQTKTTNFEVNVATSLHNRGVFFVADEPHDYPFPEVNRRLAAELPADTPVFFVDLTEDPDINVIRTRVRNGVNAGRFIVNYTGHGAPGIWSTKQMVRMIDVPLFDNSNGNLSMFFMLTCLNGYFVDISNDWLGEALFKSPVGGASVVWASTGSTTPDIQEIMATRFFHILGQGTYSRLGDAIKDSKQNAPNQEVPLTWVLLGDPALKIK